jgi:predicted nuclease with TOPRIM domain
LKCSKREGSIVINKSKTGLNDSFYKWIDQVRRSKRKLPELQEKLEYYKVKLIGYHGISYDQIGSGSSNKNGDENLLYWIDKINQVEDELERNNEVLRKYEDFKNSLKDELKIILDSHIERSNVLVILEELGLKRSSYNQKKEDVIRLWLVYDNKGFSQN